MFFHFICTQIHRTHFTIMTQQSKLGDGTDSNKKAEVYLFKTNICTNKTKKWLYFKK